MYKAAVLIQNKLGLHARPAQLIVQLAGKFKSHINLAKDGTEVNCKSILGVMMLAAAKGTEIEIMAEGIDEVEAVNALIEIVNNKFGED